MGVDRLGEMVESAVPSVEFVEDMLVCLAKFHLPNPQSLPTVMAYRHEEYLFLGTIDNEKRQKSRR